MLLAHVVQPRPAAAVCIMVELALGRGRRHRPHRHVGPPAAAAARPVRRRQFWRPHVLPRLPAHAADAAAHGARGTPLELHGSVDHGVSGQAGY